MYRRFGFIILLVWLIHSAARLAAQEGGILPLAPTPTDVKPGSITCDECPTNHHMFRQSRRMDPIRLPDIREEA
jgi:hypothetical protein